jgi:hypothetical protein
MAPALNLSILIPIGNSNYSDFFSTLTISHQKLNKEIFFSLKTFTVQLDSLEKNFSNSEFREKF